MSTKNEQHNQSQSPWTTWEDLLLSSAVKRYGLSDWSTVAMELQSRASIQTQFTAQICQNKFHDLKRRFDVSVAGEDAGDTTVPWLDELKKLRIAELREIVEGRGASIQNLNLKVKRLEEEERERSGKEDGNREEKPDLEKDKSENETHDVVRPAKDENDGEVAAGDSVSGERSERENRSVNESNSTENRPTGEKVEIKTMTNEPVRTGSVKINEDAEGKPVQADSWNDSSKQSEEKRAENESAKMRDSVAAESKGGRDSNEAQSSASLSKKSQSSNRSGDSGGDAGGGGGDEQVASESLAKTTSRDSVKNSEPLNRFLHSIRSSKYGSVFEVRLQSQNTEKYTSIIRQHVDLETVQNRVANGSYSSCTTKFYLDLLLLFNNAIVFFPKSSPESSAAYELRKLVLKSLAKKRSAKKSKPSLEPAPSTSVKIKSGPEISDPLLAKQKTSVPFTVCGRKRSSITSKPSTLNKTLKEDDKPVVIPKQDDKKQRTTKPTSSNPKEDESLLLLNLKEKLVTGARSMRRSSSTRINNTTNTSAKNTTNNTSVKTPIPDNSTNPEPSTIKGSEAPKAENKKKNNQLLLKKREAADFLKRIKKSSPAKGALLNALKGLPENNSSSGSKREPKKQPKKKVKERKESTTGRQKGNGGNGSGGKRAKEEEGSPSKRNVGRPPKRGRDEGATTGKRGKEVVEEVASKTPNKRSKR